MLNYDNVINNMYKIQNKYNFDYIEFSINNENNNMCVLFSYKNSKKYLKVICLYDKGKFNCITNTVNYVKALCVEGSFNKLKNIIKKNMIEYKEDERYYLI